MRNAFNRTGKVTTISGIYDSVCHPKERVVLEGQKFPRCGSCDRDTNWVFVRPLKRAVRPIKSETPRRRAAAT